MTEIITKSIKWNISENKFNLERQRHKEQKERYVFECETTTSKKEKIEFADIYTNGELSYILKLAELLEKDKNSLKKEEDGWGGYKIKTVSLKAWIKRNDKRGLIDTAYKYGQINSMICHNERRIQKINDKLYSPYDIYDDYVDEYFHRLLHKIANEESIYYYNNDETEQLIKHANEIIWKYGSFSTNIIQRNGHDIIVVSDKGDERKASIDEIKMIISKGESISQMIESLTTKIRF